MTIAQPDKDGVEALINFYMSLFVQAQVSGQYIITCRNARSERRGEPWLRKTYEKETIFAVQHDVSVLASEGVLPTDREEVRWMCDVNLDNWSYGAPEEEVYMR